MFGIGLPELAVIAFFGVVLLGPDKLPGLAKQLAHGIKAAKRMGDSVRDDLRTSLGEEYADLELRDLHPRELVRRQVREALDERDAEGTDADGDLAHEELEDDEDDEDEVDEVDGLHVTAARHDPAAAGVGDAGAVPLRDERKTA
ncbi:twin-arginine translocase TatA/TatE family subunit [Nocardioides sp. SYSU D00065]|uniref:twin-arginine translocase TatA/TatE family subunit n=1 Tax=Nocardioides sp. SYSU D00065 TaxID=2817378 RepID=UPI001B33512A|nr:twin-arginine translocase TatA/TatE family subunit [Nocardioides sp. SYSU D00065]